MDTCCHASRDAKTGIDIVIKVLLLEARMTDDTAVSMLGTFARVRGFGPDKTRRREHDMVGRWFGVDSASCLRPPGLENVVC